ncbi:hypothetical protein VTK73DRAFT_8529 [Phialemonium thermophilum]|uniref:Peroxin-3 n=1 Tax=Phialemonium thermophilum TaxID=223376 RepID=A0ABR3W842_9PEZI
MFGATRRWFRRNRTPIAIGLGVVGAGYVVTQYVLSKINDARERMSSERIAKENLRRRFEQNQEDCTFTVLALLPTATTNILEAMNTEKITYEIQQMKGSAATRAARSVGSLSPPSVSEVTNATDDDGRSMISLQSESGVHASQMVSDASSHAPKEAGEQPASKVRKSKRQLWDELTISAITRAYTLIYTLGLLTMLTRIQLNLLGRRSYLSSVVSLATGSAQATISLEDKDNDNLEGAYGTDFDVNRKYLTFSWWLLNRGWVDLMQRVEAAVREVFGSLSPRETLTLSSFSSLTDQVRKRVEARMPDGTSSTSWLPFLLPPRDMEDMVLRESGILEDDAHAQTAPTSAPPSPASSASLRRLLDETADLIESPSFSHVLTQLLDAGFSLLLNNKLAQAVFDVAPGMQAAGGPGGTGQPLSSASSASQQTNRAVLLPKILSVLTRQAHAIGNGMPNEYLQEMEAVRDLEGFAAVVYSSNWETEIAASQDAAAAAAPASQVSSSPPVAAGEESVVVVDQTGLFESAWEKASA